MTPPATLPITAAHRLDQRQADQAWLVDALWADEAVGILGGEPKCCKSLFALHLALAIASGQPLLGRYAVPRPGPVLFFAAEDAEHIVGDRIRRIAAGINLDLAAVPLAFITTPSLRLDASDDIAALDATLALRRPRLLVLDPFVRLHRKDENQSGDIAPILASLRGMQRRYHTAVLVVHHARKGGGSRAGQALRGSSEFHAWGDCNLFLRWRNQRLTLSGEHRAAPPLDDLPLALEQSDTHLQLRIIDPSVGAAHSTADPGCERIIAALRKATGPLTRSRLRTTVGMRNATLGHLLEDLCQQGRIDRQADGYRLIGEEAA